MRCLHPTGNRQPGRNFPPSGTRPCHLLFACNIWNGEGPGGPPIYNIFPSDHGRSQNYPSQTGVTTEACHLQENHHPHGFIHPGRCGILPHNPCHNHVIWSDARQGAQGRNLWSTLCGCSIIFYFGQTEENSVRYLVGLLDQRSSKRPK